MEPNEQEQQQPTPAQPQPNTIVFAPATVEACQADYAAAADVRVVMDKQQARQH